jgi:hypothetical protein
MPTKKKSEKKAKKKQQMLKKINGVNNMPIARSDYDTKS